MRRHLGLEATIVEKYTSVKAFLDEGGRRIWAAAESRAIGYGGDALVSDATGLSRPTIRAGRREIERGAILPSRIRRPGAGRPGIEQSQPGIKQALEKLVDSLTRGGPQSPLRWTCKSRAKLTQALVQAGWRVSSTTLGRWWQEMGRHRYAEAGELFITADAGGSNGYRSRAWKHGLQAFADDTGLRIQVSHFLLSLSKGWHEQVEQDRAPAVLPPHAELAGQGAAKL